MTLHTLVDQSCFGFTGTVKAGMDFDELGSVLLHNKPIIDLFTDQIFLEFNTGDRSTLQEAREYLDIFRKIYPNININYSPNYGHQIGAMWLEEDLLRHTITDSKYPYLWKCADDILLSPELLKVEIESADFYYIPGFSYESIQLSGGKPSFKDYFLLEHFTPQTNFYIVNKRDIVTLYGDVVEYIRIYNEAKKENLKINLWEIPYKWKLDCETTLGIHIEKQGFRRYNLLTDSRFDELIQFVHANKVGDPSHKNLHLTQEGVCHYHFKTGHVYKV